MRFEKNMLYKRAVCVLMAVMMLTSVLGGCTMNPFRGDNSLVGELLDERNNGREEDPSGDEPSDEQKETNSSANDEQDITSILNQELLAGKDALQGRILILGEGGGTSLEYVPNVAPYQTKESFSNVENADRFYLQEHIMKKLAQNNFVVVDDSYCEFFNLYESNRYRQLPSFITVDSMMHTYHLYFAMLQKKTELNFLFDRVEQMSNQMFETSVKQYELLKGTEWEEAALINEAFFAVGTSLIGGEIAVPAEVKAVVDSELANVYAAGGIAVSMLNEENEDYSQYKPRGYYEGDEKLEKYFRAMMWYGRRNFVQKDEKMNRCALLMSVALDGKAMENWESVYSITSFFAGASDDSGVYEYLPLIKEAYGEKVTLADLPGNQEAFDRYHQLTAELEPPKINSVVVMDDGGATEKTAEVKGYRFMGQRFSVDAAVFTKLCYSNVLANSDGECRFLPDALDVPAALGSQAAIDILENDGHFEYNGYGEAMLEVQQEYGEAPESLWRASLYGSWLNMLRPLLTEKTEGYPSFMQSDEWTKKNLEGYLSSYTELKHDTVLYSKQFIAEMGGGDEEILDDRGYVEPEPEVYARLSNLAQSTSNGLQVFGVIEEEDATNLRRLSELADRLKEISIKELTGDKITDDDYELIRSFGGNLEHFWQDTLKMEGDRLYDSREYPAALVVDIATNPNGEVLEQAIGGISSIYAVVPVEGKLRIAVGGVFTYYQFTQPIDSRLTDTEWRRMLGMELNDNDEYVTDETLKQPEWTQSYRSKWIYNYE